MDVTFGAALAAGILSFLSPCVLPLVVSYLGFLAGVTVHAAPEGPVAQVPHRGRLLLSAAAFVFGLATVFTLLGATANWLSQALLSYRDALALVAGIVLILFGLHLAGVLRIAPLEYERRLQVKDRPVSLPGAYLVGLAFAFGWTPCVGPVLAAMLTLAGTERTIARGAALLFVYALGLGLPFLLAAAFVTPFLRFIGRFRPYLRAVDIAAGALLVATGAMVATGAFQDVSTWLLETLPAPAPPL